MIQQAESGNDDRAFPPVRVLHAGMRQVDGEYNKVKNLYQINKKSLSKVKSDMIIMHPLPRVNEIDSEVDKLPYAKYFKQAEYGLFVRMALLTLMKKT